MPLAIVRRRRSGRAFDLDDLGFSVDGFCEPFRDPLSFLDEIRTDEGDVIFARLSHSVVDIAIDEKHGDSGLCRGLDDRNERLVFARRQEDGVNSTPWAIMLLTSEACLAAELAASV